MTASASRHYLRALEPLLAAINKTERGRERRRSLRIRTVWRVAKVTHAGQTILCRIRNLSDEGLMLAVDGDVEIGTPIRVALSEALAVNGRIVWCAEGHCGVRLDRPIDTAATLRAMAEDRRSPDYRPPRLDINLTGVVYSENGLDPVRLTDLSQYGVGLHHHGRFHPGLKALVLLENGVECRGTIRWVEDDRAGLLLNDPLPCATVNQCVGAAAVARAG